MLTSRIYRAHTRTPSLLPNSDDSEHEIPRHPVIQRLLHTDREKKRKEKLMLISHAFPRDHVV